MRWDFWHGRRSVWITLNHYLNFYLDAPSVEPSVVDVYLYLVDPASRSNLESR